MYGYMGDVSGFAGLPPPAAIMSLPFTIPYHRRLGPVGFHPTKPEGTALSSLSPAYMMNARSSCLRFERSWVFLAASLAWAKTGNSMAARIAMIAMTTRSSMSVNALDLMLIPS